MRAKAALNGWAVATPLEHHPTTRAHASGQYACENKGIERRPAGPTDPMRSEIALAQTAHRQIASLPPQSAAPQQISGNTSKIATFTCCCRLQRPHRESSRLRFARRQGAAGSRPACRGDGTSSFCGLCHCCSGCASRPDRTTSGRPDGAASVPAHLLAGRAVTGADESPTRPRLHAAAGRQRFSAQAAAHIRRHHRG